MSEGASKATAPVGAGRGLLFISAAKFWFMVAGYVVQFALPRALGTPERFGVWVLVLALVSPFNNVMVTATIQGVSKFTSEAPERVGSVVRAALRLQVLVGGGTALALLAGAPLVGWFMHDAEIVPPLRLAAGVVLCYSFYAVFVGAANGTRAFHKQAALDASYSTLRATLVVGAAILTHSATAAIGGFVAASATILVVAFLVVGVPRAADDFRITKLGRFMMGVAAYLLVMNLLMFVDGLLLKRLAHEAAPAGVDAVKWANQQEGFYGAVQTLARLPYQLILAVTFVIFPLVSKASFDADQEKTRGYVETTMRYSFVVTAMMAAALGSRPEAVMRLVYKPEYAVGAPALSVLIVGYVAFSLFNIAGTILNGAGRTRPSTAIALSTLTLATVANWIALKTALARGGDPLMAAAAATAGSMAFGFVVAAIYLRRSFGALFRFSTVIRVAAAAFAAVAVGRVWPTSGFLGGKLGTLISMSACAAVFIIAAVATGELRAADLRKLRRKG